MVYGVQAVVTGPPLLALHTQTWGTPAPTAPPGHSMHPILPAASPPPGCPHAPSTHTPPLLFSPTSRVLVFFLICQGRCLRWLHPASGRSCESITTFQTSDSPPAPCPLQAGREQIGEATRAAASPFAPPLHPGLCHRVSPVQGSEMPPWHRTQVPGPGTISSREPLAAGGILQKLWCPVGPSLTHRAHPHIPQRSSSTHFQLLLSCLCLLLVGFHRPAAARSFSSGTAAGSAPPPDWGICSRQPNPPPAWVVPGWMSQAP